MNSREGGWEDRGGVGGWRETLWKGCKECIHVTNRQIKNKIMFIFCLQ